MPEQLNICLHIEDEPYLVIESNINFLPGDAELYADVWQLPTEDEKKKHFLAPNKRLATYRGQQALTDAVLHLSEILGEPVAHRIRKVAPCP